MARSDPARVHAAMLTGSARALHDLVVRNKNRSDFSRKDWPELWERIDLVIELAAPSDKPTF